MVLLDEQGSRVTVWRTCSEGIMSQIEVTPDEVSTFVQNALGGRERLLTSQDVAEFEQCHPQHVRRLRQKGVIKGWHNIEGAGVRLTVRDYLASLRERGLG